MVGQWVAKARKMAGEFQGQFQEAMREAEMADLKKSFDEVREAASGFASGNVMTSLQKDVSSALSIEGIEDKPAASVEPISSSEPVPSSGEAVTSHAEISASQPPQIAPESRPQDLTPEVHSASIEDESPRDAKAS
jgi:sec-independent protein translocase protein TatB